MARPPSARRAHGLTLLSVGCSLEIGKGRQTSGAELSLHFLGNRRSERVDFIGDLRFQGLWVDVYKKVVSIYCEISFFN